MTIRLFSLILLIDFMFTLLVNSNEIRIQHFDMIDLTLDVLDPSLDVIFPIEVVADLDNVKRISFLIEHPFYGIEPVVVIQEEYVSESTHFLPKPDQAEVILSLNSERIQEATKIAEIQFEGTTGDFFNALQIKYNDDLPQLPIRHSPPLYPVHLKNVLLTNANDMIEEQADRSTSIFLFSIRFPRNNEVDNVGVTLPNHDCTETMRLGLVQINDIPVVNQGFPYTTNIMRLQFDIDENGSGSWGPSFFPVGYLDDIYEPTMGVFHLFCGGRFIAESKITGLFGLSGHFSSPEFVEIDFSQQDSGSRNWQYYQ